MAVTAMGDLAFHSHTHSEHLFSEYVTGQTSKCAKLPTIKKTSFFQLQKRRTLAEEKEEASEKEVRVSDFCLIIFLIFNIDTKSKSLSFRTRKYLCYGLKNN